MARIEYSGKTFDATGKVNLRKDILEAVESSPALKDEVRRVFQIANRRIQNIENSGQLSPAVAALNKGDITGFTKFSMRGEWNELKSEYTKAVSFLQQPTSTATGAREYGEHLKRHYGLSDNEFDLMSRSLAGKLQSIEDSEFVERYLKQYKDFTGFFLSTWSHRPAIIYSP